MDKFDRFQRIDHILATSRRAVPTVELANKLECSTKTVQRTIEQLRYYRTAVILLITSPLELRQVIPRGRV